MEPGANNGAAASDNRSSPWFATTHWSVVLAAGGEPSDIAEEALAQLLRTYWRPLYAFVRRHGHSPDDAQELVQAFLSQLVGRGWLSRADPARGRFRSFLLASLSHFLANRHAADHALKRGGGITILPMGGTDVEAHFLAETSADHTPEMAFDRHWALTLLEVVLSRLRREEEAAGHARLFDLLKPYLEGEQPEQRYAEIATQLNTTTGAVRMRALRLRRRYRALITEEIGRTLADPTHVQDELQALLVALRGT